MIKDLINAIAEGDTLEIDRTFNSVMAHKISERLDSMRVDVAQSMFNSQMVEEGYSKYSPRSYHMTKKIEPFYSHSIDKDGNHVFRNSGDVTTINPNDTDALTNYAKRISMDMNTQGGHLGSSSIGMTYGSGDQQKDVDAILAKLRK